MKPCIACGKIKPIDDFYLQKGMKDGHLNKCKQCCVEQAKYRAEHNIHKPEREWKTQKECFVCHKIKPLKDFHKQKGMFDGRLNKCKECCKNYCKYQRKTNPNYYMRAIYNGICSRCREDSNQKNYRGLPVLSKEEWLIWTDKNMKKFMKLYRNWQKSGYNHKLAPSIDKINNKAGYLPNNLQWLTVSQNCKKSNK